MSSFTDEEVKQQVTLSRDLFNYVLGLIEPKLRLNDQLIQAATRSSGSPIPIMFKLWITLRLLRGGKVQDLADFPAGWKSACFVGFSW